MPGTDAAHADHLASHLPERELLEQMLAVGRQSCAGSLFSTSSMHLVDLCRPRGRRGAPRPARPAAGR